MASESESESARQVRTFERASLAAALGVSLAAGFLRAAPVLAAVLTLSAAVDLALALSAWQRSALWVAAAGAAAAALASAFRPARMFSVDSRSRHLAVAARARGIGLREDELRLAVETASGRSSGSADLRLAYLDDVARRLARCRPSWSHPGNRWSRLSAWSIAVVLVTGCLWAVVPALSPLNPRILNPFQAVNLDRFVRLVPGDASVPFGADVEVRLEALEGDSRPELMVKTATGWSRRTPATEGRERRYVIRNVVEPVSYRVRWKGEWSRRYQLTPVEPIRISGFRIELRPPAYTGQPAVSQTSPEISGLAGSAVSLSAVSNRPMASAVIRFSDGRERPVTIEAGTGLRVSFTIETSGTYAFVVGTVNGTAEESDRYPVNVVEDQPPEIILLSPVDAISAGERERIPLTFDVRDDIRLAGVRLEWESRGRTRSETAKKFEAGSTGGIFTHEWNLRNAGLSAGDSARYRLVASDGNSVTGPGETATPWMDISVESFEREHEAVEQALEAWRDRSIDLLAQMNTLKSKLDRSDSPMEPLAAEFNQASQLSQALEEALGRIVSRMESDPLADYGVTMEHRAMLESFRAMNRSLVPSARASLNTGNRASASSDVGNIASELERMTSLSEELSKRQNARDVVESGDQLEKLGEELEEALASGAGNDPALSARLNEIMNEARKNLEQLARSLQQMPQELPEDFVNQQALKSVELGKTHDLLNRISDAVRRGDMKTALDLARQFLAMTRQMRESLSQAHESFTRESSASGLQEKIARQQERLQKIVDEQRALLAETQKLETSRLERRMKAQEQAFKGLAARQRAAVNKARSTALSAQQTPFFAPLGGQVAPMETAARELESGKLDRTFDLLPAIVTQFESLEPELARVGPAGLLAAVSELGDEEAAILQELKKIRDDSPPVPGPERPMFDSLRSREEELARQAGDVRQQLQGLSRETASLGLPITQPLTKAAQSMRSAGESLGGTDSRSALSHEQTALSHLLETQNGLSQAQSAMSEMAGRSGAGSGPRVIARPGGGTRGAGNGRVRLPTADEYRPPREFREDLLESLKENYPKIYEEIIHRYYRRLAE